MIYDIERLEDDLLALVKSGFPAKLAAITAEKADGITLDVPTDDEYFSTTDDEVDNRRMAVMHGVIDGGADSIGAKLAEDNRYMFLVYINDLNESPGVVRKKLHRYTRALTEIFRENFRGFPCVSRLDVQSISPTETGWGINENSPMYKVGGIFITATIAG